jgi:hypothetical protein
MAWAEYTSEVLTARTKVIQENVFDETVSWRDFSGVESEFTRSVKITVSEADGFSLAGARAAAAALEDDGHETTVVRTGQSGKHAVRWSERTIGDWSEPGA